MQIINNRMIFCMLTALQVYGASVQLSDESVAGVFRVRHKSASEASQTELMFQQRYEVQERIEGLMREANYLANSNPEHADLIGNMGLTLDQRFVDSMGEEFSRVNVVVYKGDRDELRRGVGSLQMCLSRLFRNNTITEARGLILVNEFFKGLDLTEACFHLAQDPDPNDLMCRWKNFLQRIKDTKRLVEEHLTVIYACIKNVDVMVQDEGSSDDKGSCFTTLGDEFALINSLKNYAIFVKLDLTQSMCKAFDFFEKCFERERSFRKDNPLVLLQEKCAKFDLQKRCDYLRDNLDEFLQMECEISFRLETLARSATFFKEYEFEEDIIRFLPLGMEHAEWYDRVIREHITKFIDAEELVRKRAMGDCFYRIISVRHILHNSKDALMLPPIYFKCGFKKKDLCGNLEICIKILEEIKGLAARQSRQKESLQRSMFGVVCDQTAEDVLGDKFPYIQELQASLLGNIIRYQNERSKLIDKQLSCFSEFLKIKEYMKPRSTS
ncbi:MAG: hypothetical protein OXC30_00430 [Alphaproteobacteria bacterium]|nr:hypothetical protein [Alphaproteobacteria bacterium]